MCAWVNIHSCFHKTKYSKNYDNNDDLRKKWMVQTDCALESLSASDFPSPVRSDLNIYFIKYIAFIYWYVLVDFAICSSIDRSIRATLPDNALYFVILVEPLGVCAQVCETPKYKWQFEFSACWPWPHRFLKIRYFSAAVSWATLVLSRLRKCSITTYILLYDPIKWISYPFDLYLK